MYDYVMKKQNSLTAKKSKKSNNLSLIANSTPKYIKKTQNQTIQLKNYTIVRTFFSNLWSYDLYQFFKLHLPEVTVSLRRTDYVGGSWEAQFTYDTDIIRATDINRVIALIPRYRDNSSDDETLNTSES